MAYNSLWKLWEEIPPTPFYKRGRRADSDRLVETTAAATQRNHSGASRRDMLIEVEVFAGENSQMELTRVFDLISEPRPITGVITADQMGRDRWCDVTGWSATGPCPARAALSEDSGEGVVLLVFGGDHGIRLKPADCREDWDIASENQWGEACLLLDKNAPCKG